VTRHQNPTEPAELDLTGDPIVYDLVPQPYWEVMLKHCAYLASTEWADWQIDHRKMNELDPREQELAELVLADELFRLAGTTIPAADRQNVCRHLDGYLKAIAAKLQHKNNRNLVESTITWFKDYAHGKVTIHPAPQSAEEKVAAYVRELATAKLVKWKFGDSLWIILNDPMSSDYHTLMETMVVQRLERQIRHVAVPPSQHAKYYDFTRTEYAQLLGYRINRVANRKSLRADMRWLQRYCHNQLVLKPSTV